MTTLITNLPQDKEDAELGDGGCLVFIATLAMVATLN
jgi:hypothetical protein